MAASRGLAWPEVCGHWLLVWLLDLVTGHELPLGLHGTVVGLLELLKQTLHGIAVVLEQGLSRDNVRTARAVTVMPRHGRPLAKETGSHTRSRHKVPASRSRGRLRLRVFEACWRTAAGSDTGQPLGLCNASHALRIAGLFHPGRPGQGRRNCGDVVLGPGRQAAGPRRGRLNLASLSLQVQALDPGRHTP
jgi:hypothetical protein